MDEVFDNNYKTNLHTKILEKENNNIQNAEENRPLKEIIYEENIKEKKNLKKVLQNIENKLNEEIYQKENGNIQENENENENENEDEDEDKKNNKIETNILLAFVEKRKDKKYIWFLWSIFSIFLPLFISINLIGIFQIISVMNALYEAIKRAIVCYLDWENKEDKSYYESYNFYSFYFKESINEGIEFDLIETMGFLGTIFVKFYGFRISSILFMILDGISLFLIMNFFSQYNDTFEKYSILQILYLIACYILLFIGVGSSALLSQQLLIDNYEKYSSFLKQVENYDNKDEKKDEIQKKDEKEEEKQNIPYFILICLTSIIGFLFKYILNVFISYRKYKYDNIIDDNYFNNSTNTNITDNDNEINNIKFSHDKLLFFFIIVIYVGSIIISISFYHCFRYVYEEDEIDDDEEKSDRKYCQIFGYMFYLQKVKNINKEKNQLKQSVIRLESEEKEKITVTKLFQADEYIAKKTKIKEKKRIFRRTYECIKKYCSKFFFNLKILSDSLKTCCDEIICRYFCCGKQNLCRCCFCCECCSCCGVCVKIEDKDYELNEGYFCYCYKSKKNLKWFNRFIRDETQIKLLPLLVEYFLIQLSTVAFETIFDENNEEGYNEFNDFKSILQFIFIFAFSLFLFFYLTISFSRILIYLSEDRNQKNPQNVINKIEAYTGKLSNKILNGTYGLIIFNGFYSFIVSLICLSKDVKNNYYFYIPILMNKFYFFTFAHHCTVYTDIEDEIDFFSCATLLSIYLQIWDFCIDLLKICPINVLLIIQIIFSSLIILLTLYFLSLLMCFFGYFWLALLYLLSFLFSFGGFWFFKCHEKYKCEEYKFCSKHKEKCHNEECIYKCFKSKENYEMFKNKIFNN